MPHAQTLWHVQHREHDLTLIADIRPENLQFSLNREPPHTIQYELSLSRPEVTHDFVGPYRTDFRLMYGDTVIMAGPHTSMEVSYGDDHCTVFGKDWSHILERTMYPFDPRPSPPFTPSHVNDYVIGSAATGIAYEIAAGDVAQIIQDLADVIFSQPYRLNLTYPTLTTHLGIPTNFTLALADTTFFADIIRNLSQIDPGFVWEVLWTKELRLYSPHKYDIAVVSDPSLADFILDSTNADAIEELTFTNNGPLATHLYGNGNGIGQATYGAAVGYPPSQLVYRRLDETVDVADTRNRAQALARTMKQFSVMLNPSHEVTLKLDPSKIVDFWVLISPGSTMWIDIDLIAHGLQSAQEIVNMNCTVNTEGDAIVDFGFEQVYTGTAGTQEG